MPKERSVNSVQAQRKAEKAKAIKKGKADVQAKRNERLAKQNPERIQQRIDELKAITTSGGKHTRHEEQLLEGLEKELKAVTKAREALGDRAPPLASGGGRDRPPRNGDGVLGKRRRDGDCDNSDDGDDDVPEDVRNIPMPRDTPPPIPKEILDQWWARRRARRGGPDGGRGGGGQGGGSGGGSNANAEPLVNDRGLGRGGSGAPDVAASGAGDEKRQGPAGLPARPPRPPKPVVESKTVYEAAPIVRDLRKEAVSVFTPAVVRAKLERTKSEGGKSGAEGQAAARTSSEVPEDAGPRRVMVEDADEEEGG